MLDPMLLEAQKLIEEFDTSRKHTVKEYRVYYNEDGTIIGLWENDFPGETNYIVVPNPDLFHKTNSYQLRVINGELKRIEPTKVIKPRLTQSTTGQPVVKNQPALALNIGEEYPNIEYYDRNR